MKIDKIDSQIEKLKQIDTDILNHEDHMGFSTKGILNGFDIAIHKMEYNFIRQIFLGMMGGAILGLAYVACMFGTIGVASTGIKNIINGVIFPAGIILITFLGGGLFTSHVFAAIPAFKGCVKLEKFFSAIFGVFSGNFLGTFVIALICEISGVYENKDFALAVGGLAEHKLYDFANANEITNGVFAVIKSKMAIAMLYCFGSGILCNLLVSATVPATGASKSDMTKLALMFLLILLFIVSGYQHSPANTFVFWSLLFEALNTKMNLQSAISVGFDIPFYFLIVNIVFCMLGNFVGGGIITPGIISLVNREYTSAYFVVNRIKLLESIKNKKSK